MGTKPKTKHFALWEWEKSGKAPQRVWPAIQRVMNALEVGYAELEEMYGEDRIRCYITKAGGYRSQKVNKANKGRATRSRHLKGDAADVVFFRLGHGSWVRIPFRRVFHIFDDLQKSFQIQRGGLAAYPDFIHIDTRHGDRIRKLPRWRPNP
ncbi:MAG: hypothetical protein GY926_19525 [bacterium]|nr:hypothetical protein [bacterium]